MASSAENHLAQLIVDKIEREKDLIRQVARGTGPNSVKFDVLPSALFWYHNTDFSDSNSPVASGTGVKIDINSQIMWISEYPLFGAVVFGNDQEEALLAAEELKQIAGGFWPQNFPERDLMYPLHPAHFAVPFPIDGTECVGLFFQIGWQFQVPITYS